MLELLATFKVPKAGKNFPLPFHAQSQVPFSLLSFASPPCVLLLLSQLSLAEDASKPLWLTPSGL